MGNIVQCCHTLLSYIKGAAGPTERGAEGSPLLSSDGSTCDDSLSLLDELDEDLLTVVSDTATSAAVLEREHFLFPDILLSSGLGADEALVEPMVCLLVSAEEEEEEEEEGDHLCEEVQERSNRGKVFHTEVETQTEGDTHFLTGVQALAGCLTEVHTQTDGCVTCSNQVVGREQRPQEAVAVNERTSLITTEPDMFFKGQGTIKPQPNVYLTKQYADDSQNQTVENCDPTVTYAQQSTLPTHRVAEQIIKQTLNVNENQETIVGPELPIINATNQSNALIESNINQTDVNIVPAENGQMENDTSDREGQLNETEQNMDNKKRNSTEQSQAELCSGQAQDNEDKTDQKDDVVSERVASDKQMTSVDRLFLTSPHVRVPPNEINCVSTSAGSELSLTSIGEDLGIQEVVSSQEMGFTVRIQAPGTETFELQVSDQMLVAELHQLLMDHKMTCHRTCFSLQLGGTVLEIQTELCSIAGLQQGAPIKVVEDPYTIRDARLHLRHVRNLLRSLDPTDAHNGVHGSSLSYLSLYTQGEMDNESSGRQRASKTAPIDCSPPEYILPRSKDLPLSALQPMREDSKPLQCLRVLTMSSWNPPPGNRKMHGDLMYLNIVTMEDRDLNISCSTRGFYLNQSTVFTFNPKPAIPKILCHSLVELLNQVSPAFRKTFSTLQKKRLLQHPYERVATAYQVYTWTAPHIDHALDCVRAEETHTSRMGQDELTAGQVVDTQSRDWNEELQGCRELPRRNLQERLHRERNIFKTNSDFVGAATQGAIAVVDGNVMAINPGEDPRMQMFMWNNMLFSLGFDVAEHYRQLGGDAAAHAAAVCDLRGLQAYASVDVDGLYTLGTVVVDYRGNRVIAQSIVPGILEKTQEQSVVYGSNDNGKTVFTHPRFLELLDKTCGPLKMIRHQVLDHNNSSVELCSCVETKGILGNDGRPYILDLIRTFPPDVNFHFSGGVEDEGEAPEECRRFGYPQQHRHSLATLRAELIEAFVQHRHDLFLNMVSVGLSELEHAPKSQEKAGSSADITQAEHIGLNEDMARADLLRREVVINSCKAICSVSDSSFDIRFNPDVCFSGVRFPPESAEGVQKQKTLLWDAASFLLSNQIPAVLRDCLDQSALVMDGATLTSALHQRGVNVRYLGSLLQLLERSEEKDRLGHIQRIAISELIIRSAKHIFRVYLQDVEPAVFSAAVSHFLNCLLSSSSSFIDSDELPSRRRSRRRRSYVSRVATVADSMWARLTPSDLWGRIRKETENYYHYTLLSENADEAAERYGLQKVSLLRETAIRTGIQVQLRDYVFETHHRPIFSEEDVVNMFPVVKHIQPTPSDASRLVQQAQTTVQQGLLREGYSLLRQALVLFNSVCGLLHEDMCTCFRLLGRLSYIMGHYADALSHQEKAVMTSERVRGIDHPQTIQDYTDLGLYCFAGGEYYTSLRVLYRARYLSLLVCGGDHPHLALLDSMLGLVLHGLMHYELALKFLQNALILTLKYYGAMSLKHAHSQHLLAMVYESKGEFRLALQHEKEAFMLYKSQVGENHESTKESSEYLKSLTQQAVSLQKVINHIYSNTPSTSLQQLKFSIPSIPMILQHLNLACGIILIPLSAKEMVDMNNELKGMEKTQVEN